MSDPNVTTSPNMSLPVPDLADPGPDYATNVNTSLEIIDGHTHTGAPADGLQLDLSKQLNTGDIELNDNNLGTARSVEFQNQPGALTGSQDVNCIYVNAGVLGFNNSSGTFVPLAGPASALFTNFTAITVTANHVISPTDTFNLVNCNSPAGAITVTLPRANTILPTPAWRLYVIRDIGKGAATFNITIAVTGGSGDTFQPGGGTSITITSSCGYILLVTDGVANWYVWGESVYNNGEVLQLNTGAIANFTGAALNMDAASSMTLSGTTVNGVAALIALLGAGSLLVGASNTLNIDAPIGSESTTALNLRVATVTISTSGTSTLTGANEASPIININPVTLSGDAIVKVPTNVAGGFWILITANVNFNGHGLQFSVNTWGAVTIPSTAKVSLVVAIGNGLVFVLNSA